MRDQADDLRQLVRQRLGTAAAPDAPRVRLLAVSGGKGGVGATTTALNLAIAFAQRGGRVVLVDADPHGGDLALRCRLEARHTLADVLSGQRSLPEAVESGPAGIRVLPGAWGVAEQSPASPDAQQRLVEQLQALRGEADWVVIDTGDGLSRLVRRFWLAADAVLVLTTPDLASVMAAYGAIKVLAAGDDGIRLRSLVTMAPCLEAADDVHARLARVCRRFLGIPLSSAGYVPLDAALARAGEAGEPFLTASPTCPAARQLEEIARMLAVSFQQSAFSYQPSEDPQTDPSAPAAESRWLTTDG
jgi:flagellar biosynthesis protein FlhG